MSLGFSANYKANLKSTAVPENWIARLYYGDETKFIGISDYDRIVSGQQYYGIVSNWGEITEVIDITTGKATISDTVITCANKIKNKSLSDILYNVTDEYLNRKVEIYSLINGEIQILFTGILASVEANDSSVQLRAESRSPWYGIKIPKSKTKQGELIPLVYGTFGGASETDFYNRGVVYPMPIARRSDQSFIAMAYKQYSLDTIYDYDNGCDAYFPLTYAASTYALSKDEVNFYYFSSVIPIELKRTIKIRPTDTGAATYLFQDPENSYDGSTSTMAEAWHLSSTAGDNETAELQITEITSPRGKFDTLYFKIYAEVEITSVSATSELVDEIAISEDSYGAPGPEIVWREGLDGVGTTTKTDYSLDRYADYDAASKTLPDTIILHAAAITDIGGSTSIAGDARVYDFYISGTAIIPDDAKATEANKIKFLYGAGTGIEKGYSGGTGAVTLVNEIYRDLMARFTDYDPSTIDGWSDLATDRSNWAVSYWIDEEDTLENILNKVAYEGGFVFKFDASGDGKFIYVKPTYSSSDVVKTFTTSEIEDLNIGLTPFDELITGWEINYAKSAAGQGYQSTYEYINTSAKAKWNISSNENNVTINLDLYSDSSFLDETTNDNFLSYYNNIVGEPKILISFTSLINTEVESGDIIQISNSDVNPFGKNWNNLYFMVTETSRTPGRIMISAREVYSV